MEITGEKLKGYFYFAIVIVAALLILYAWNWYSKFKVDPQKTVTEHPVLSALLLTNPIFSFLGLKNLISSYSGATTDSFSTLLESGNQTP